MDFLPIQQQVLDAIDARQPIAIMGAGSKAFYGNSVNGQSIDVTPYHGIGCYEPSELVVTVKCGTRLSLLEQTLADNRQILPFEPPSFNEAATVGGTVACGLSGPRRAFSGALRDYVLGVKVLNGKGEVLNFGGQVMKNVAGYDLARLFAGSLGTLGIILEVSFKVLPAPRHEISCVLDLSMDTAIETMNRLAGQCPLLSASVFYDSQLYCRFSGMPEGVERAAKNMGGEVLDNAAAFWRSIKEQRHVFFEARPLWRFSVPSDTPPLPIEGACLIDWGGGLRWYSGAVKQEGLWGIAKKYQGQATLFKRGDYVGESFQPLPPSLLALQQNVKQAFDPYGLFNRGRMYLDL